jgi:uncharacterized OsmC-like protein
MAKMVNGVDVDQLMETIEKIKKQPEIAGFRFRAKNSWLKGTHNRATVKDFFGAGQEDDSRSMMEFDMDEPPVLLGANQGGNPVEYLLVALSGCVTTSLVAHAAAKGIEIRSVSSRLEGDIDLRGFLNISESVPVGYQEIRLFFRIDADLTDQEKESLIQMGTKFSPVFNTVTKGVPVKAQLER